MTNDIKAELLAIPDFSQLAEGFSIIDVETITSGSEQIVKAIADANKDMINTQLDELSDIANGYEVELVANRYLKFVLLQYLARVSDDSVKLRLETVFDKANNMSEKVSALTSCEIGG